MKILYLHQYFKTPNEGGAIRSYHIAKSLVDAGHEVVLLTTHNQAERMEKEIAGIFVIYLPIPYSNEFSFLNRIKSYRQFQKKAIQEAKKIENIDLVYATSTPLTVGLAALKLRLPFIFEIRDLWPKIPIELGYIHPFIGFFLYRLERKIYKKASAIISLSPETKAYVNQLGFGDKNHLIPNMSDCVFFQPSKPKEVFTICYTGTFGVANHLKYLVEIAKVCHTSKLPIHFILVGEGKEFHHIRFLTRNLPNVTLEVFSNKERMREILHNSCASYISFLNHSALEGTSPNKFFDALAAGKLIIVNTNGWLKDYVEKHECGFHHHPEDIDEFIEKISLYLENKTLLEQTQLKARACGERDFSVENLTQKVLDIMKRHTTFSSDDNVIR